MAAMPEPTAQQRRALYMVELRRLSNTLPCPFRDRFSASSNALLDQLADSLVDGTVFEILRELSEIQRMTERQLYQLRQETLSEQRQAREELLTKNRPLLCSTTFYQSPHAHQVGNLSSRFTAPPSNPELVAFDGKCEEELKRTDMKIVLELDQVVSQQQSTLEKAGIPGFYVTNKPEELRLQMYILDFLEKLNSLLPAK